MLENFSNGNVLNDYMENCNHWSLVEKGDIVEFYGYGELCVVNTENEDFFLVANVGDKSDKFFISKKLMIRIIENKFSKFWEHVW